jgi:hypothetical protein
MESISILNSHFIFLDGPFTAFRWIILTNIGGREAEKGIQPLNFRRLRTTRSKACSFDETVFRTDYLEEKYTLHSTQSRT